MSRKALFFGIFWTLSAPLGAATIAVPAGSNLQTALNNAQPGDTLVLQAGATYFTSGGFVLPNKGSGSQVITLQSSDLSALPAAGFRVHPSDAPHMPKLISSVNGSPVVQSADSAHHYTFIGVEIALDPGKWSYTMVMLGQGTETSLSQLPHDIVIDRCYIHGDPTALPGTKRGVQLNGIAINLINSYISEIHVDGQDSQAAGGWNGPGPFLIKNNYLEASTENVLFGGADPAIPNLVPSDIQVLNNYFYKPLSWYQNDPSFAGTVWTVKNLFELKNAQRVLVDGNIFENNWKQAQVGYAIVLTPRNQQGTAPWSRVKDVTFTRNIVRHTASAVNTLSSDDISPSQPLENVLIQNNLFDDINRSQFGGDGRPFQFVAQPLGASNIQVLHNTTLRGGGGSNALISLGDCCIFSDGWNFDNNIGFYGDYGLHTPQGEGAAGLNVFMKNWTMVKNAMIGGKNTALYPGNFFPADASAVGFVDYAAGDYHLAASSPYKNAGTDGKDIGADIDQIIAATCGVIQGVPTATCTSIPLPPPPPFPPPGSGPLPAPTLGFPSVLPVNAEISASEPAGYSVASYNWSIVRLISGTSGPAGSLAQAAGTTTFSTPSGAANLGTKALVPGTYQITVTATASNGSVSPQSQKTVTLVPADFAAVRIYPNPWRQDRHARIPLTLDGLPINSSVKIFTASGHWVKTLPQASPLVTWDLRNDSGDRVASGMYLYLITASNGEKTGQFVIIK